MLALADLQPAPKLKHAPTEHLAEVSKLQVRAALG